MSISEDCPKTTRMRIVSKETGVLSQWEIVKQELGLSTEVLIIKILPP